MIDKENDRENRDRERGRGERGREKVREGEKERERERDRGRGIERVAMYSTVIVHTIKGGLSRATADESTQPHLYPDRWVFRVLL